MWLFLNINFSLTDFELVGVDRLHRFWRDKIRLKLGQTNWEQKLLLSLLTHEHLSPMYRRLFSHLNILKLNQTSPLYSQWYFEAFVTLGSKSPSM